MGVEAEKVVLVEVEVGEVERRPATVDCSGEPSSNLWFLIKMTRIARMVFRIHCHENRDDCAKKPEY